MENPPDDLTPVEKNKNCTQMSRDINKKREDFLSWTEYFMATAFLAAKRSKDPCSQVGACIVNDDKKIVGIGYNGMPTGCSDDDFPWTKKEKHLYVCHAEMNAIVNKNSADIKNCTIYVVLFPCDQCAKIIIQSGLREVVYLSDKHESKETTQAAKRMFDSARITYRQHIPQNRKIEIDFEEINWDATVQRAPSP